MADLCPHCWPSKTTSHLSNHLDYYHDKLLKPFLKRKRDSKFWGNFLKVLSRLGLVSFVSNPDSSKLYNRSLIFFNEAKKRNLKIDAVKAFGKYDNSFRAVIKGKTIYYEGTPLNIIGKNNNIDLDNKIEVKKHLQKNSLPVADGGLFTSPEKAEHWAKLLGYPLIVKPSTGSLSHHVSGRIDDLKALRTAIKIVQQYRPDFIVERYVEGKLYRATVINQKHVFVCLKEPANVIGDGHSSILNLIKKKNKSRFRGEAGQKDSTLHKISIDKFLTERLKRMGYSSKSVLPKHKKIYLYDKTILGAGCDVIDKTDLVHPINLKMFIKTAKILNADFIGLDFICKNIARSYLGQSSAVIEANSLPYVDMHQFPTVGKAHPIAKIVWDTVLKSF